MNDKNIVHGPAPLEPIPDGTAGQQIYEALLKHRKLPVAVVNVDKNISTSFEEILQNSTKLAACLKNCGYGLNSVLAICSENSYLYYYPLIAGFYLGIAVAPLNPDYIKDELRHALSLSKPSIIFCSANNLQKVLSLRTELPNVERIVLLDSNEQIDGVQSLDSFIEDNLDKDFDLTKFKPTEFDRDEQVAVIMCSSGTTGLPKGVMLTHKNVVVMRAILRDKRFAFSAGENPTSICAVPMVHVAGLGIVLLQLLRGAELLLMDKFNSEVYLKAIQDYKIDSIFTVPALIGFLAKSPRVNKYDISCLKFMVCATAPLSQETEQLTLQRLNKLEGIAQAYGMTEATLALLMSPLGEYRAGSSGKVLPYISAKVVDIITGKSLGPNERGELYFKGDALMKGYIGNDAATEETIDKDGWMHTGDIGYYDDDGFFFIVDRIKELIKYKGFQVPPAELESFLLQHPDIRDAGVIGVPDEFAGELPTAFVVKQDGSSITDKEIVDYIAEKVSDAKRLRGGVYFIEELPRNPNGKILRRELRDRALKMLKK